MSRLALLVGIDGYSRSPLAGCEADALAVAELLGRNADESANFQSRTLVARDGAITRAVLRQGLQELFGKHDADCLVFFFAGHGSRNDSGGFLVTQDGTQNDEGVPMAEVIRLANACRARERIIILDCCHAGAIEEMFVADRQVPLSEGVSILAACRPTESAVEFGGRGLFSTLICEALEGSAADVRGKVTVAGIYTYVNEVLTGWDQRPLFAASLSKVSAIRQAAPAITDDKLRRLTSYFPSVHSEHALDPSYEPSSPDHDPCKIEIFSHLQQLRAARMVEPVG